MNFFAKRQVGRVTNKPLFALLHAGPGVGKTNFGESFPKPHFFDHEESTDALDVSRTRPTTFRELMDDLHEIYNAREVIDIRSLIFDPIDELERLIHNHVVEEENEGSTSKKAKKKIREIGYKQGYIYALDHWSDFISLCRSIRNKHKMNFLFIAHSHTKNETNSELQTTYTRHTMALHPKAVSYLLGQVEMVLYAKKRVAIVKKDGKTFVKDLNSRVICTSLNAAYDAKNRIGLPAEIDMPPKGAYDLLKRYYDKAVNQGSEELYKECIELANQIESEEEQKGIKEYCDQNKNNLIILRACKDRLLKKLQPPTDDLDETFKTDEFIENHLENLEEEIDTQEGE